MKKLMIICTLTISFLTTGLFSNGLANKKFSANLNAAFFINSDENFRELYGNGAVLPHLEIAYSISRDIFLGAAYGSLTKNVELPYGDVKAVISSKQQFISVKIGLTHKFVNKLDYFISGGLVLFSFSEDIESEVRSDQAAGFVVDAGFLYHLDNTFFTEFKLGYLNGSTEIDGNTIKLGGILSEIGIGLRF